MDAGGGRRVLSVRDSVREGRRRAATGADERRQPASVQPRGRVTTRRGSSGAGVVVQDPRIII